MLVKVADAIVVVVDARLDVAVIVEEDGAPTEVGVTVT